MTKSLIPVCARSARPLALTLLALWLGLNPGHAGADHSSALEQGFVRPPAEVRLRAYWWWLNGSVTQEPITHERLGPSLNLQQMGY